MRALSSSLCLAVLTFTAPAFAQTGPTRDPQSVLLLQRSLAAFSGGTQIQDITLTGTVQTTAGSETESGTATFQGTLIGQGRVGLELSSGTRSEVRDVSPGSFTGSWSGPNGTWHPIAGQNLETDPTWFFPAFLIARALSNTGYSISPPTAETLNGTSVERIELFQAYAGSQQLPDIVQHLSKVKIYLSPQTLLPAAIAFNIHPDDDALTDIPVRVQFSDYQPTQGAAIAHQILKYVQNGLVLSVTLSSAQINTGLTSSAFQAQ